MSSEKNSTRERILKSTWSLLESERTSLVRMSDIAKAAKVSRQAVYLHFPNRAELLVATTRYLDEVYDVEGQLEASRNAASGQARLRAWIDFWGNYIPKIYGVSKALMVMKDNDEEALQAWNDRMLAVKDGCEAAVKALKVDGLLRSELTIKEATDILWALLSIQTWAQLRYECGWAQDQYILHMQTVASRLLMN
jgi:AcrR family transcriptional regulator